MLLGSVGRTLANGQTLAGSTGLAWKEAKDDRILLHCRTAGVLIVVVWRCRWYHLLDSEIWHCVLLQQALPFRSEESGPPPEQTFSQVRRIE